MADYQPGRGGRGSRYQGRGRGGRGGTRTNRSNNGNKSSTSNLGGACEELRDNVYSLGDARQADRYTKTTEEIINFIQRTFNEGQDVVDSLTTMTQKDFEATMPTAPEAGGTAAEKKVKEMYLQQKIKNHAAREEKYVDNMNKAYALILGQCTKGMKNKLEQRKDWQTLLKSPRSPLST